MPDPGVVYFLVNYPEELEAKLAKGETVQTLTVVQASSKAIDEKTLEMPDRPVGARVAVLELKKRYALTPIMKVVEIA